ncbi:MAG: flagellar basal body rod protein FlgC [Planctomycetes bacterium]|nr:flagellar basal body rod protein FlgC [Planctomycetota bacterium]
MLDSLDVSASALAAQRMRTEVIANNLANAHTTRDAMGRISPYRRQDVVFRVGRPGTSASTGVHVEKVVTDRSPFRMEHDPGNPDANAEGFVQMPNVNPVVEMVNMMDATRAYELNVTAMDATKGLFTAALRILA